VENKFKFNKFIALVSFPLSSSKHTTIPSIPLFLYPHVFIHPPHSNPP
jgi:hypothetical protein